MARYIDAVKSAEVVSEKLNIPLDDLVDVFAEIPTADVVEVKHGEWELKSETRRYLEEIDEEFYVECPFCNRVYYVPFEFEDEKMLEYAKKNYPYCNCGAKMDKENAQ